jgi:hypothetical protein
MSVNTATIDWSVWRQCCEQIGTGTQIIRINVLNGRWRYRIESHELDQVVGIMTNDGMADKFARNEIKAFSTPCSEASRPRIVHSGHVVIVVNTDDTVAWKLIVEELKPTGLPVPGEN